MKMKIKMTMPILAALIAINGCLADDMEADARAARDQQALHAAATALSTDEFCRSFMRRQSACTDSFIPALVDARVNQDNPPGIRARADAMGREAFVKEALDEWASDSAPAAREALCDDLAQSISADKDRELRSALSECLAESSCGAFTRCAVPLSLVRWKD